MHILLAGGDDQLMNLVVTAIIAVIWLFGTLFKSKKPQPESESLPEYDEPPGSESVPDPNQRVPDVRPQASDVPETGPTNRRPEPAPSPASSVFEEPETLADAMRTSPMDKAESTDLSLTDSLHQPADAVDSTAPLGIPDLDQDRLAEAIVLNEVLARPVGLRGPGAWAARDWDSLS